MEQMRGIEPPYQPWQGCVLPLNYICKNGGPDGTRTHDLLRDRDVYTSQQFKGAMLALGFYSTDIEHSQNCHFNVSEKSKAIALAKSRR